MQYLGNFSGSSAVIKKYKASATGYIPGIVMQRSASSASGQMTTSTTTAVTDTIGLLLDNGMLPAAGGSIAYSTTQGAAEAVFGVITNPDSILRAQMVSGATGVALTAYAITTAASNGLTVVTANDGDSPEIDEGIVWYTSGTNVGKSRKITSNSTVTQTVIVPFAANAVGDLVIMGGPNIGLQFVTFTTDLTKVRADAVNTSGAAMGVLDFELNGTGDSYIHLTFGDCVWNYTT